MLHQHRLCSRQRQPWRPGRSALQPVGLQRVRPLSCPSMTSAWPSSSEARAAAASATAVPVTVLALQVQGPRAAVHRVAAAPRIQSRFRHV